MTNRTSEGMCVRTSEKEATPKAGLLVMESSAFPIPPLGYRVVGGGCEGNAAEAGREVDRS